MRIEHALVPVSIVVAGYEILLGRAYLNKLTELTTSGMTSGPEYDTVLNNTLVDAGIAAAALVVGAISLLRLRSSN